MEAHSSIGAERIEACDRNQGLSPSMSTGRTTTSPIPSRLRIMHSASCGNMATDVHDPFDSPSGALLDPPFPPTYYDTYGPAEFIYGHNGCT
ncbi:hypothetical protein P171DRAFT_287053 [Karstenula rhodostoma CBS 690.94]|uniref:Uncharacterized protein n=1 Tax=Karstenula rhodostoma CBS 690.94 TaxID=1392251 RepID=A0A9P4PJA4_9PLEO|nr:hypothetical protein P171DRAFT_287053 [Karstenula rhodostoma CBS 690.94]